MYYHAKYGTNKLNNAQDRHTNKLNIKIT